MILLVLGLVALASGVAFHINAARAYDQARQLNERAGATFRRSEDNFMRAADHWRKVRS